jgi:hypothetical protein
MSEQRPQSESDDMASDVGPSGSSSTNGTYGDAAVAIAEQAQDPAVGEDVAMAFETTPPDTEGPDATDDATDAVTDAADDAADATAEAPVAAAESVDADSAPDDATAFMTELARAMQSTAGEERKRVNEDADRRRDTHLAAIQARRETEVKAMQDFAAEDLKSIDAWAEEERQRIDQEREQRAATLQADLDTSLAEHGAKIDREVETVEAAIAGYRTEVEAFFATLEQETDPVAIALHARRRPAFPSLETVPAAVLEPTVTPEIASSGIAEPGAETAEPGVGVMDPDASASLAEAWAGWKDGPASEGLAEALTSNDGTAVTADVDAASDQPEPVAVVASDEPAPGTVLRSTPIIRPFGWFSGDKKGNQDGDR